MKKLTILTSLSYLMKGIVFEKILATPDKFDLHARVYATSFNRRLNRIKEKYEYHCFEQIEVINFFSPIFRIREEQLNIEKKIIKLIKDSCYLNFDDDSDVVQNYMTYINSSVKTTLIVLDVTDVTKGDIINLVHAVPFNKNDFYIKFYSDE